MFRLISPKTTLPAISLLVLASSMPALSASQCKGLVEASCAEQVSCQWIDGYVRKDGRSVSSHCKTRPGKKAASPIDVEAPKLGQVR
jgi:hypothetical protein